MIKVALLGDSGVGKTALLNQCTNCGFSDRYRATTKASARIRHIEVDGVTHTVQIWDCAGNERFHTLAPQFFHDIEVCALVYDITSRRSFQRLDHWLSMFRVNAGDGKVVMVVGTKSDLYDRREVDDAEVHEWCARHGTIQSMDEREPLAHFVVSAKLGDGTMDFLHASVRVASSKERSAAPPPPRSLMDGIWRGQGTHNSPSQRYQGSPYGHSPYGSPYHPVPGPSSPAFHVLQAGPEIVALKQKVANLDSQLATAEASLQESELTMETLKRQLCDVRNQELMGKLEMQERLADVVAKLQKKDDEIARLTEQYSKRIAHLESQLSQRDAHLAFGADPDLEEENVQLQEENANLKDTLRRSQALVQELQAQLQKARQRPPASSSPSPSSAGGPSRKAEAGRPKQSPDEAENGLD
eukprot:EG_transcript_12022